MNRNHGNLRSALILAAFVTGGCLAASAQQTNAPAQSDYSQFKMIADRNIFDPNRYPRRARSRESRRGPETDAFSLVGTMSYGKGTFAFFDGTSATYRKALEINGDIAGYKVKAIGPNAVKLEADGKQIEMKVGTQLRHEEQGGWLMAAQSELPTETTQEPTSTASVSTSTESSSSGEVTDVLKKLMQQREQELK